MSILRTLCACILLFVSPSLVLAQSKGRDTDIDRLLQELRDLRKQLDEKLKINLMENHPRMMELPGQEAWYLVQPDGSIKLLRGKAQARHTRQWNFLKALLRESPREVFTTFVVYNTGTKVKSAVVGAVAITQLVPKRYAIALNQHLFAVGRGMDDIVLAFMFTTIVHEYFGHLVLAPSLDLTDQDGCLSMSKEVTSVVEKFAAAFWQRCLLEKRPAHKLSEFTSEYAPQSVVEDLAETAASFVVCDRPRPQTKSVVARKILFLWDLPEAVQYREHARKVYATNLKRTPMQIIKKYRKCE